jgi:uncharacterized protein (DUF1800 family)
VITPKLNELKTRNFEKEIRKLRKVTPKKLSVQDSTVPRARVATSTGLSAYQGEWSHEVTAHLLKRTLFGFKTEELSEFENLNLQQAISQLITNDPLPEPPVNDYHYPEEDIEDPHVDPGETWIEAPYAGNEAEGYRIISLKSWLINNMLEQPSTIHEKMIFFWHNLLVTQSWDVFVAKASYQYFMTLRTHALGNFKALVKAITLDPSMLIYLNGTFNNKEAPDENFARELQELFCIGKGPEANFTEEDVQAAARVLTGWVIDWDSFVEEGVPYSFFYSPYHDTENKQFSEFYGSREIIGKQEEDGVSELDELMDMIFDNEETARYICRRIYQFFVYSEIDDSIESNVIIPLARIFRENDYEIVPVLEALLSSEHFFDPVNRGALIKNPIDFLVGAWKSLKIPRLGEKNNLERLLNHQSMLWTMANQGLEIGDPPSVSGWPAYYQVPQYDKYWITTDTITNRAIASDSLWFWGFWVNQGLQVNADLISFIATLEEQDDPNLMLKEITELVLGIPADDDLINNIKFVLLNGQQSDAYWTTAWQQLQSDPENEEIRSVVNNRLKLTFQYIFQLGECQLM